MVIRVARFSDVALSVDTPTDGSTPVGKDFEADLDRVGRVASTAIQSLDDTAEPGPAARAVARHFDDEGIPPEEAIAAAWLFILTFAE